VPAYDVAKFVKERKLDAGRDKHRGALCSWILRVLLFLEKIFGAIDAAQTIEEARHAQRCL